MTIEELNAKYGKPATVANNTDDSNPFGWTTKPTKGPTISPKNSFGENLAGNLYKMTSDLKEPVANALPTVGGIVGGIGGGIVGSAAGPVGTYGGGVAGSAAGGALGEAAKQKLLGQDLNAKEIVKSGGEQALYEGVGGPIAAGTGKLLKGAGKAIYDVAIPTSAKEASQITAQKASTSLWDRMFGKVPEVPTVSKTAFDKGFAGTQEMMGVQARKEATNLFENIVKPELKASSVNVNKDAYFKAVEDRILKNNPHDLTQQKALTEALNAVKEDYKDITHFTLEDLQGLKESLTKKVPQKYYAGKDITGSMANLRAEMSNEARKIIRANVSEDALKAYDDYGNLKALEALGNKARTGSKFKGGTGGFISGIRDMVVTPVATIGGQTIYKTGKGIEFTGPSGAKTLGHVLGLDSTNSNSTNPY